MAPPPCADANMTEGTDFEAFSWHDCHVWSIDLQAGDPDVGDWRSELALDIDYIVDWVGMADGETKFRVAPATLIFHGASDLRIAIEPQLPGGQVALHPLSIDHVERTAIAQQKIYLDRPYYSWKIVLNWPSGGEISFGAWGFGQTLRAEPILTDRQHLTRIERESASLK